MEQKHFGKFLKSLDLFDEAQLQAVFKQAGDKLGVSDHFHWRCVTEINQYDAKDYEQNGIGAKLLFSKTLEDSLPVVVNGNMTLNKGIEMLWKLFSGDTTLGTVPFSTANARIYVGSDITPEEPSQTGVLNSLGFAEMEVGYPQIQGRLIVFRGVFPSSAAIGKWNEVALANGSMENPNTVSLNRKVADMPTKTDIAAVTVQMTLSIA